ncbi:hypothetical protein SSX86_008440 [Deinandra increscens subsp. villosa]|uniref:RRM domain-containing protein n=1 Tax=Deinandra increscens subsp. villosa TaxID=3103831 RepID=A0AAP0DJ47_9ASTR
MSRSRSIRPRSRSRSVGRDRKYQGGRRDRSKGLGFGRDGSRVRFGSGEGDYGYERRGQATRFSNTNLERFRHGEFDNYGTFHEYDYGGGGDPVVHANPRGWEKVVNRKAKYRNSSPALASAVHAKHSADRWMDVDAWSSTVFVTNFPTGTTIKGLWDRCSAAGKVVDVFISEKLSSVGKKFGFVRFVKGVDISNVIYKIRNLWFGSFRLFADVSKFKRGSKVSVEGKVGAPGKGGKHGDVGGNFGKDRRYVDVVGSHAHHKDAGQPSGSNGDGEAGGVGHGVGLGVLHVNNNVPVENFVCSRLLKVRDVKSMSNLYHIVGQEGFCNVSFRYVGGWWVQVDCSSIDECAKFSNCKSFKSVFSECKRVVGDFVVNERMVWINISGLPLGAWSSKAFTNIASKWGKVCFVDNDLEEPLACGKVCILTSSAKRINETIVCKVADSLFEVSINEHQYWTPIFDVPCDSEEVSSDEEGSDFSVEDVRSVKAAKVVNGNSQDEVNAEKDLANSDPFGIMDFLNKKLPESNKNYSVSLSVPPGFERIVQGEDGVVNQRNNANVESPVCDFKPASVESINAVQGGGEVGFDGGLSDGHREHGGFGDNVSQKLGCLRIPQNVSLLEQFSKYIDFGVSLGLDMEGAKNDLQRCIIRMSDQLETHVDCVDVSTVRALWGNVNFNWVCASANGRSGGIVAIWDPLLFVSSENWVFDNVLIVKGEWAQCSVSCFMVIVYAPQASRAKRDLWSFISIFMEANPGDYIVFGDFNVSRFDSERLGVAFHIGEVEVFNSFIDNCGLEDVNLGGFKFTRMSANGLQQSKLDRFLVSSDLFQRLAGLEALALGEKVADHRPILLRTRVSDYGPVPFKFYNYWISLDGYEDVVKNSWDDPVGNAHGNCFIRFKEKLKLLKSNLKGWNALRIEAESGVIKDLKSKLAEVEVRMENGIGIEDLNREKCGILLDLGRIERRNLQEISQKIKSKWVLEGDENSRFFHAYLKKRRRVNTVRGIKVNGDWLEDPVSVKNAFHDYHSVRFKEPNPSCALSLEGLVFSRLPEVVAAYLCSAPGIGEECKVSDRIKGIIRIWSWRRDLRGGVEELQWNRLVTRLTGFSIGSGGDVWGWDFQGNDVFEVKQVRKAVERAIIPD